jgi:hypothetical protein
MLLGSLQEEEYTAEYGILVLYDHWRGDADGREPDLGPGLDPELLELTAARVQPGGTVAHAGTGWLWARASSQDTYHVTRLESHDGPPADDHGDWDEVLETPYWSSTGAVQLGLLTGGPDPDGPALPIGRPGRYRVRVSCVRDPRVPGSDEYRSAPRRTPPGFPGPQLLTAADEDGAFDEGDVWRLQFWPTPADREPPHWLARTEPVTAGEGDEDTGGQFAGLATDLVFVARWTPAGTTGSVAGLAARVLATPDEVRGGLADAGANRLLAVNGDLAVDQAPVTLTPLGGKPPGDGELQLTPWQAARLAALARLAFANPDDAGDGEGFGDLTDPANLADLRRRFRARFPLPEPGRPSARAPLPDGPPPAAGVVTSNRELVVWRAGAPVVIGRVERGANRALATPYGIVVTGPKLAVLVRPDGGRLELAPDPNWRVALSADGRHIAIASARYGRRPRFGLYLADLTDGSAQALDLPDPVEVQGLVHGAVRYCLESDGDGPAGFAWTPGSAPVPAPYLEGEFDRLSGARLTMTEAGASQVTRRDGTELIVEHSQGADEWVHLSPGGRWLYHFSRYPAPAALTVTDVSGSAPGPRVTWPLPDGSTGAVFCEYPSTWEEDNTHVLLPGSVGPRFHPTRVDAATGAAERPRLSRQGRGKPGLDGDGAEFDFGGFGLFVEPFRPGTEPAELPANAG